MLAFKENETEALARAVLLAAADVHSALGPGYGEAVYENAICLELNVRNLPYARKRKFFLTYKGVLVGDGQVDLVVADELVVHIKAREAAMPAARAQALSFLRATGRSLAIVLDFNVAHMEFGAVRVDHFQPGRR